MNQNPIPARGVQPGRVLSRELDARGWTQKDLAEVMGRPPQAISEIVNGTKQITPQTALELAQALGTSPEFWTNLEANYQLWLAKRQSAPSKADDIARRSELYSLAPVRELVRRRWIRDSDSVDGLAEQLFSFLRISSPRDVPGLAVKFRASEAWVPETSAQIAWVQRVQALAGAQRVGEYRPERLRRAIPELLAWAVRPQDVARMPEQLAALGVHLLLVPHLPKTYLDGAAFYLDDHPVIALTLRHDRIDAFWFTLMHELAHILGGHPAVYLDNLDIEEASQDEKERQANQQARDWLLEPRAFDAFVRQTQPYFSRARIEAFALAQGRHPGIVLGRLQHERIVEFSHLRALLVRVKPHLRQWIDVSAAA